MKIKLQKVTVLIVFSLLMMAFMPGGEKVKKPIYLNPAYSFNERAADLVSRMTPEEKQSQLGNTMPPIPRLGVNHYDVWGEALHGIMGRNNNSGMTATSFPNSVAVGATWDPELIKRETKVISDEARGFNHDVIFTLTYWSPVIEPARDPRWGRTAETFGEDPFLVSQIGLGFIRGLMGDDPTYLKAVPCGKHYFANNTEFNRHSGSANMDDRDMHEFYLSPYRSLIREGQLPAIMTAYSAVNGIPVSAGKFLVDTIVRKTYGLDGYVTGDCGAIDDMVRGHHYAGSNEAAVAMGIKAGVDTDCGSVYQSSALKAVQQGILTEGEIDKALVNIFTIRMRIGEFDPPEIVPYTGIKPGIINDPSHNNLALEIATKTPVLLKNSTITKTGNKALPIDLTHVKKIAVLGPQADKVELGDYSGRVEPHFSISPLEGIQNYIKEHNLNTEIVSMVSGNTDRNTDFITVNSFSIIRNGEVLKEYDATKFVSSAPGLIIASRFGRTSISGIKDGDWTAYDNINITDVDSIRFNLSSSADGGILEVRAGSAAGNVLASATIGSVQQSGGFPGFARPGIESVKINTLGITGPQTLVLVYREAAEKEIDAETLNLAASCDAALIFVGTDQSTGREESDRFAITLPGNQNELINAVAAVNPNTIVVMQTMGMVEVEQFKNLPNISGIIWTGYNGQAQGTAMAKILFGDVSPGGKLNVTWHKSLSDLPDFNNYTLRGDGTNGRTYWYFNKDVSFEFGFGLSYTTFAYSNFAISKTSITPNDKITVSVDVHNTGSADGDEVVQVYVKTPDSPASLERPIKRLKGFKRVSIPRGQVKTVSIDITLEKNVYYLNFDAESVSDEFNGGAVDSRWEWIRENLTTHSLSRKTGSLTITSETGGVLEATNNAKNILLQSANNDWTIETRLVCSRTPSQPENAGILVYQNDDNFVKLMFRAVIKTTRARGVQPGTIDLVMEENGIAKSLATFNLRNKVIGDNALTLKLEKKGSNYTAFYSTDGKTFEFLGTAGMLLKDIRAGLIVCDGIVTQYMKSTFWFDSDSTKPDTPFDVWFDYFRIKNSGLK
ncbi:MAG: glycoside hydrolase family 3 C-terminal domain-containing protein [Bacteroidales bacterium]